MDIIKKINQISKFYGGNVEFNIPEYVNGVLNTNKRLKVDRNNEKSVKKAASAFENLKAHIAKAINEEFAENTIKKVFKSYPTAKTPSFSVLQAINLEGTIIKNPTMIAEDCTKTKMVVPKIVTVLPYTAKKEEKKQILFPIISKNGKAKTNVDVKNATVDIKFEWISFEDYHKFIKDLLNQFYSTDIKNQNDEIGKIQQKRIEAFCNSLTNLSTSYLKNSQKTLMQNYIEATKAISSLLALDFSEVKKSNTSMVQEVANDNRIPKEISEEKIAEPKGNHDNSKEVGNTETPKSVSEEKTTEDKELIEKFHNYITSTKREMPPVPRANSEEETSEDKNNMPKVVSEENPKEDSSVSKAVFENKPSTEPSTNDIKKEAKKIMKENPNAVEDVKNFANQITVIIKSAFGESKYVGSSVLTSIDANELTIKLRK